MARRVPERATDLITAVVEGSAQQRSASYSSAHGSRQRTPTELQGQRFEELHHHDGGPGVCTINVTMLGAQWRFVEHVPPHDTLLASSEVPRAALCHSINNGINNVNRRFLLHGPKGNGKSYLAYLYVFYWRTIHGQGANVRWFSGRSREAFGKDYRTFAEACFGARLTPEELNELGPELKIRIAGVGPLLLILDGVEDAVMVDEMCGRLVEEGNVNVYILVTTSSSTICASDAWAALPQRHLAVPVFTDAEVAEMLDHHPCLTDAIFRGCIDNHPQRVQWVAVQLRYNPDISIEALLRCIQAAVPTVNVDVLGYRGWALLCAAALFEFEGRGALMVEIPIADLNLGMADHELMDAGAQLQQCSLAAITFSNLGVPTHLALHPVARCEAALYARRNIDSTPSASRLAALTLRH